MWSQVILVLVFIQSKYPDLNRYPKGRAIPCPIAYTTCFNECKFKCMSFGYFKKTKQVLKNIFKKNYETFTKKIKRQIKRIEIHIKMTKREKV